MINAFCDFCMKSQQRRILTRLVLLCCLLIALQAYTVLECSDPHFLATPYHCPLHLDQYIGVYKLRVFVGIVYLGYGILCSRSFTKSTKKIPKNIFFVLLVLGFLLSFTPFYKFYFCTQLDYAYIGWIVRSPSQNFVSWCLYGIISEDEKIMAAVRIVAAEVNLDLTEIVNSQGYIEKILFVKEVYKKDPSFIIPWLKG